MNIWLITDTHLGHKMLIEKGYRPADFEDKILINLNRTLKPNDVLIHLGDVCIGNDAHNNKLITKYHNGTKILVKGNHDKKSNKWYLEHGWDFVCEKFIDTYFGQKIIFSHEPQFIGGETINIHGHWHDNDHRKEPGFEEWYCDQHRLLALEATDYKPVELRKFLNQKNK